MGALLLVVAARPPGIEPGGRHGGRARRASDRVVHARPRLDVPAGELCAQAPRPAQEIGDAVRLAVFEATA
jgi:hypothetical protein